MSRDRRSAPRATCLRAYPSLTFPRTAGRPLSPADARDEGCGVGRRQQVTRAPVDAASRPTVPSGGGAVARIGVRSLVAGVVSVVLGLTVGGTPAAADEPLDDGSDRSWAAALLTTGTPSVRRAAEAALLGSDAQLDAFVDTGFEAALAADYRASAQTLGGTDGPALKAAATTALAGTDAQLKAFVDGGFRT
ncbi:hypothetical protein HGA02_17035, partial [Cellulomonas septica]